MISRIRIGLLTTTFAVCVYSFIVQSPAASIAMIPTALRCLSDIASIIENNRQK